MKKTLIGVVALLVVLAVGAGCFWAGMSYGQSHASQNAVELMRERFGDQGDLLPGGDVTFQRGQRDAAQTGGTVWGTIEAIEGTTLIINSNEETVRVETTDTTLIEKMMAVGVDDLEVGKMIVAMGSRNDDGSLTARSVQSTQTFTTNQQSRGQ